MSKRVTIILEDKVNTAVRKQQAKQITATQHTVSFSSVVNDVLKEHFRC